MQAGNANIYSEVDRCLRLVFPHLVGSLPLTPHLPPCWGLRYKAECKEEKETQAGGRGFLGKAPEEAVFSGSRGDKKDAGTQRTSSGRETDRAKLQRKASMAQWGSRDQLCRDLVWGRYASRFAWASPGLPPPSHSIIVYCIPFDSQKVSLFVQYMTLLLYLQGRGRGAYFIYYDGMDFE